MTTLEIKDLGPIKAMFLDLSGPVVLLSGPHGSGKSTVANALSLMQFGETARLRLKKDLPQMIRAGADQATITFVDGDIRTSRTLTENGLRGGKSSASVLDKIRMNFPWEALSAKPSVWKSMLGSVGLSVEDLQEVLADLPIANEAIQRAGTTLESTIKALEDWRLELHRAKRTPPEISDTVSLGGQEIDVRQYLPHEEHYKEERQKICAQMEAETQEWRTKQHTYLEAENTWREFCRIHNLDPETSDRRGTVTTAMEMSSKTVNSLTYRISDLEQEVSNLSQKTCPTCARPWAEGLDETQADLAKATQDLSLAQYETVACKNVLQAIENAGGLSASTGEPLNQGKAEAEIKGIDNVLQAITMFRDRERAVRLAQEENERLSLTRKQVQAAIERLRDPRTSQRLVGTSTVDRVRSILRESCEILGLPPVVLTDDLTPAVRLEDESERDAALLSDTQRALAGLALCEAFARVQGLETTVVDQLDWVHGDYVETTVNYIEHLTKYYKRVVVLTASQDLGDEIKTRLSGQAYSLKSGTVESSFTLAGPTN